jgi:hypothetical protein
VLEAEFLREVGPERVRLTAGDSLLAPRRAPHFWASVGESPGTILAVVTPAGKVETFFRETTEVNAPRTLNPAMWRAYGMEYLGSPLPVAS